MQEALLESGVCECSDLGNTSSGLFGRGGINNTPKERGQAGGQKNAVAVTLVSSPEGAVAASG